jgi:ABC-type transport system involved in multi-copper enzyme maturation permease subunit
MWTIAKLTVTEMFHKRIFQIIFGMSFLFLFLYGLGTHYIGVETSDLPMDALTRGFLATKYVEIGLYCATCILSLLAIFSSMGSIAREVETHQIDPLLSRDLARRDFVLGRFLGLSGILLGFAVFMFVGVTEVNQWFGHHIKVDIPMLQFMKAFSLFVLQPIILVVVSLFFSARMSTFNTGIIMVMLYIISTIGGFIEQFGGIAVEGQAMVYMGIIISLIFPLDALFRKMTFYLFDSPDSPISFATIGSVSVPSNQMIVYVCLYGVLALWLSVRSFSQRDV